MFLRRDESKVLWIFIQSRISYNPVIYLNSRGRNSSDWCPKICFWKRLYLFDCKSTNSYRTYCVFKHDDFVWWLCLLAYKASHKNTWLNLQFFQALGRRSFWIFVFSLDHCCIFELHSKSRKWRLNSLLLNKSEVTYTRKIRGSRHDF
jgi:hypothetical protein